MGKGGMGKGGKRGEMPATDSSTSGCTCYRLNEVKPVQAHTIRVRFAQEGRKGGKRVKGEGGKGMFGKDAENSAFAPVRVA